LSVAAAGPCCANADMLNQKIRKSDNSKIRFMADSFSNM